MSQIKKSFLLINRQAPYGCSAARDALDVALTASVFEQDISLLFLADGVFQLLKDHQPQGIKQKNLSANLAALPMYDIDQIFVSATALQQRGLNKDQLSLPAEILDDQQIAALISRHDQVMSF
ncbi:sulfurtransferase complex subunit TusC [Aliamphritea ceti]|uniref:sulfurtransferase complex subunit TusC n=1 Tax=Aliamphritea ceti TaxID=1524258 RepID=UPI0021C33FB3|nr:sulfurtransferase complex subunit TusC [Aliamphritea ceti]